MIGAWWRKNVIEKVHAAAYSGKYTIHSPVAVKFIQVRPRIERWNGM